MNMRLSRMGRETKPAIERFMNKVKINQNGCWLWIGSVKPSGYGVFAITRMAKHKTYNAHRWSYIYFRGEIPEGLTLDHLCRNRKCVNPHHLEAVTMRENLLRGQGVMAINSQKTHCPKCGHDYYFTRGGFRSCRLCEIRRATQWNKKNHERYLEIKRKSYHSCKQKEAECLNKC